ncbi:MAG: phosphoenolpyruvate kinase [Acidobacteria bacterium]|nr:MAG: phosphoenolpyruvate kinase [Acidobacteriota bacterium]
MKRFPGNAGERQPVHTVYGGAQLFKSDTTRKLGEKARSILDEQGVDPFTFARAIDIADVHAERIWQRVVEKLAREPVEDFRIDFEDGYGNRPDDEEDRDAERCAREVATGMREGTLPPFIGIRIKPFSSELMRRSLRTLDIFLTTLLGESNGKLPSGFVVTLPKIQLPEQVTLLVDIFDAIEPKLGLAANTLRLEFMIETTQSILSERGESNLPRFLDAARGRAVAAHFGTYDYTASCNITASEQRMDHPACDFARHMMQIAYAGTGIWLSDGATNVLPIGDRDTIHRAWKLHVDHIRHSLINAYYQGWDLHPAQLPTRYAAIYSFFLEGLAAATERLRNFMQKAGQATLVGDVFDDAATGQGLLNYFIRGINSGALTEEEALATGLTIDELRSRSFVKILQGRRGAVR